MIASSDSLDLLHVDASLVGNIVCHAYAYAAYMARLGLNLIY